VQTASKQQAIDAATTFVPHKRLSTSSLLFTTQSATSTVPSLTYQPFAASASTPSNILELISPSLYHHFHQLQHLQLNGTQAASTPTKATQNQSTPSKNENTSLTDELPKTLRVVRDQQLNNSKRPTYNPIDTVKEDTVAQSHRRNENANANVNAMNFLEQLQQQADSNSNNDRIDADTSPSINQQKQQKRESSKKRKKLATSNEVVEVEPFDYKNAIPKDHHHDNGNAAIKNNGNAVQVAASSRKSKQPFNPYVDDDMLHNTIKGAKKSRTQQRGFTFTSSIKKR